MIKSEPEVEQQLHIDYFRTEKEAEDFTSSIKDFNISINKIMEGIYAVTLNYREQK